MIKFLRRIFGTKTAVTSYPQDYYFDSLLRQGIVSTFINSQDYLDAYQFVNYVGQASDIIASDIASLSWKIKNSKNEEVNDKRLISLLNNPHKLLTHREFTKICMLHLLLDGNCFIVPGKTNILSFVKDSIDTLLVLNPSLVKIHTEQGIIKAEDNVNIDSIKSYQIKYGANSFNVEPEKILQGKTLGPNNIIRGIGVIQRNATNLDADKITSLFNKNFLRNGVVGDYQLVQNSNVKMGKAEWELIKRQMRQDYEGVNNWFKIIFPPENSIQIQNYSGYPLFHRMQAGIKSRRPPHPNHYV